MGINVKDARWPGCSAENFGRFIPCRGGGTDTTYYSDHHEVDEDITTSMIQGGRRDEQSLGGVTNRNISDYPSGISDTIASRLIYLS